MSNGEKDSLLENDEYELQVVDLDDPERQGHTLAKKAFLFNIYRKALKRRTATLCLPAWLHNRKTQASLVTLMVLLGFVLLITMSGSWALFINTSRAPESVAKASTVQASAPCYSATLAPDNQRIATLEREYCLQPSLSPPSRQPGDALIQIFRASNKQALKRFPLYSTILNQAIAQKLPTQNFLDVQYQQIAWSPDGKQLICAFQVSLSRPATLVYPNALWGLWQLNEASGAISVLFAQQNQGNFLSDTLSYAVWDLQSGSVLPAQRDLEQIIWDSPRFSWGKNGQILAQPAQDEAAHPVGIPSQGQSFTLWQPGIIQPQNGPSQPRFSWSTTFFAWSPDRRYLALFAWSSHVERLNARISATPPETNILPSISVHDNALNSLLTRGSGTGSYAWRPNGHLLALYNFSATRIELYDCATGARLRTIMVKPDQHASTVPLPQTSVDLGILQWSTDGTHLLLVLGNKLLQVSEVPL